MSIRHRVLRAEQVPAAWADQDKYPVMVGVTTGTLLITCGVFRTMANAVRWSKQVDAIPDLATRTDTELDMLVPQDDWDIDNTAIH
jgi:hypothetical protein